VQFYYFLRTHLLVTVFNTYISFFFAFSFFNLNLFTFIIAVKSCTDSIKPRLQFLYNFAVFNASVGSLFPRHFRIHHAFRRFQKTAVISVFQKFYKIVERTQNVALESSYVY
jgi:hypothetical protein